MEGVLITPQCKTGLFYQIVLDTYPIFLMIVVFETIIYPFFKAMIPSMLKRIGLGMCVAIVGLLALFIMDVYGYNRLLNNGSMGVNFTNSSQVELNCFLVNDTTEHLVNISVHAVSVIMLSGALAETLLFIAGIILLCTHYQSAYSLYPIYI